MSNENTITTTRTINFPIEKVWNAWSNPDLLKVWWGPNGFTNTFHEHDFREGGKWIYTMHGPEAGNYENDAWYERIEAPTFLQWNRNSQPRFRTTVQFQKVSDSATRIVWNMIFETAEMYEKVVKFAADKNEENLDRLEALLRA